MKQSDLPFVPRAIVATTHAEVRDYLVVQLRDRGFAIEVAHRPEYLRVVADAASVMFAESTMIEQARIPEANRPRAVFVLSRDPNAAEALNAARTGARRYLPIPFADAPALASMLDALAAEARADVARDQAELVGVS